MLLDVANADLSRFEAPFVGNDWHGENTEPVVSPILAGLRSIQRAGERIYSIRGLLSGSLNWLFANYRYNQSFCALLEGAHQLEIFATDSLAELSGMAVQRELPVIAREAGISADVDDVSVSPVIPNGFDIQYPLDPIDRDFLDRHFSRLEQAARAKQLVLRYVAWIEAGGYLGCGLGAVPRSSALAQASPESRLVEIHTTHHANNPMLINEPWGSPAARAGTGEILELS